jgi:rRNA pseudouridine-1189 N-methylase Emg1 (Nep1/Mra1 family)
MKTTQIEILLDKYFDAETTVQEEAIIKDYFASNEVAQHLKVYQPLFTYLKENKRETTDLKPRLNTIKKRLWLPAAAVVLIAFSIGFFRNSNEQNRESEWVYQESAEALQLASKYLNKGNEAMAELNYLDKSIDIAMRKNK